MGPRQAVARTAWAISWARTSTAADLNGAGSWLARSIGGAGTWSGSRLSCVGCTVVLLGRWLPCSLLRDLNHAGDKLRNHLPDVQEVTHRRQHTPAGRHLTGAVVRPP